MTHIRYIIAFIGWCFRKLLGSTIDNIQAKHEWFYRHLQREPFLAMLLWLLLAMLSSVIVGLIAMCWIEDREAGWLVVRGWFWLSFGYMMMGHLTNALKAFEREREELIEILRDKK